MSSFSQLEDSASASVLSPSSKTGSVESGGAWDFAAGHQRPAPGCGDICQRQISLNPSSNLDIESIRRRAFPTHSHTYTHRDVILYHLGLGCTLAGDPHLLYEGTEGGLAVLPTYAIVAAHAGIYNVPLEEFLPGMRPVGYQEEGA
jgi:hypothetical protein